MSNNGERRRTIVYSNVNKKAEMKSAFPKKDVIDLDDEVVIGLTKNNARKNNKSKKTKSKANSKKNSSGNDELKALWESEKEEIKKEQQLEKKKGKSGFAKKIEKLKKKEEKKADETEFLQEKKDKQSNVNKKQLEKVKKQIKANQQMPQKKVQASNGGQQKNANNAKPKSKQPQNNQLSIQERIKRQKRRIIAKISFIAILVIIAIAGFVYFLLSPVFNIKNINVINNTNIPASEIINSSKISVNENMFKFSKREAKKAILQNPYVEEVKIKRKPFNTVEIIVKERTATLMLEYGNSYVYINNQGYILEISTVKLDVPMLTGYVTPLDQVKPGNRLSKADLERLSTVLNIIQSAKVEELDYLITKIDIKNKKDILITFESEGKVAHMGECSNLPYQMQFIRQFIDREKGIEGDIFVDMDLNKKNPVFREKV